MSEHDEEKSDKKSAGGMTDLARRILLTGLGAIFMTEEGIRKSLGDLKVPKDAMGYLVEAVRKQKDDALNLVAVELSRFFSKVRVHEELQKALSGLQLHLDAKLTFDRNKKSNDPPPRISVKKTSPRE